MTVALNTGGSNTLARQIVEGAPVGLFLSADDLQMDVVEKAGRLVPGTRTRLLTNELAVVVPQMRRPTSRSSGCSKDACRVSRWASRPRCLPASTAAAGSSTRGRGARLSPKVVPFPTVRAVLSAVEAGRVDAGIVYRTDAIDVGRAGDRARIAEGSSVPRYRAARGGDRRADRKPRRGAFSSS